MRHHQHTPAHWFPIALVTAAALLALSNAYGQGTGAAAMFEGRPALAGAQGGLGAQGGMPQGGLGVQGTDATRNLVLRKPGGLDGAPPVVLDAKANRVAAAGADTALLPGPGPGVARDQRSVTKKVRRAAKRTVQRARHGVSQIDASASAASP